MFVFLEKKKKKVLLMEILDARCRSRELALLSVNASTVRL